MSDLADRAAADRWVAGLATAEPAEVAGLLRCVGPDELSHRGRIDLLIALARHRDWLDAQEHRVLAALAADHPAADHPAADHPAAGSDPIGDGLDKQYLREEVACALRVSPQTAAHRLTLAAELTSRLPDTVTALEHAALSGPMARRIAETLIPLDDATATRVQHRVLRRAGGQTFAQFSQSLRRAVLTEDPRGQAERHHAAVAERAVRHWPSEHGMAELHATLRADHAAACYTALDDLAHQQARHPDPGDERTLDQRRADALHDLLTGQAQVPADPDTDAAGVDAATDRRARRQARRRARRRAPQVHVTVALSTLLGLDDQPGELAGHGPIPAELARHLAADPHGTWHRLITDHHGQLIDYGRTRYRPPASLINHVQTRDLTCRMPRCHRPATACEIDHIHAWTEGGHTTDANLHPLCRRDHHLKHEAGWHVTRLPDGTTRWTTPTGHTYDKPPEQLPLDTTTQPRTRGHEDRPDVGTGADPPPD